MVGLSFRRVAIIYLMETEGRRRDVDEMSWSDVDGGMLLDGGEVKKPKQGGGRITARNTVTSEKARARCSNFPYDVARSLGATLPLHSAVAPLP
mmetsp:Transcript_7439/g.14853  ORF Transcript_7439/g.14853 Transcript_7439/m.14853 type:complete len:94 (+) Transcript_7439:53-334(+)